MLRPVAAARARSNGENPPAATATSQNSSALHDPPAPPRATIRLHHRTGNTPASLPVPASAALDHPQCSENPAGSPRPLSSRTSVPPKCLFVDVLQRGARTLRGRKPPPLGLSTAPVPRLVHSVAPLRALPFPCAKLHSLQPRLCHSERPSDRPSQNCSSARCSSRR